MSYVTDLVSADNKKQKYLAIQYIKANFQKLTFEELDAVLKYVETEDKLAKLLNDTIEKSEEWIMQQYIVAKQVCPWHIIFMDDWLGVEDYIDLVLPNSDLCDIYLDSIVGESSPKFRAALLGYCVAHKRIQSVDIMPVTWQEPGVEAYCNLLVEMGVKIYYYHECSLDFSKLNQKTKNVLLSDNSKMIFLCTKAEQKEFIGSAPIEVIYQITDKYLLADKDPDIKTLIYENLVSKFEPGFEYCILKNLHIVEYLQTNHPDMLSAVLSSKTTISLYVGNECQYYKVNRLQELLSVQSYDILGILDTSALLDPVTQKSDLYEFERDFISVLMQHQEYAWFEHIPYNAQYAKAFTIAALNQVENSDNNSWAISLLTKMEPEILNSYLENFPNSLKVLEPILSKNLLHKEIKKIEMKSGVMKL